MHKTVLTAVLALAIVASAAIANVNGWRALVVSRLLRVDNHPIVARPPAGFVPRAPSGFTVNLFANGFQEPRWLAVATNGDLWVADSAAGQIVVLRRRISDATVVSREVFAGGLTLPFGIAFADRFVYVACTDAVLRFPYDPLTSTRLGDADRVIDLPGGGYNQHWTRGLALSPNGDTLFVSVGSRSNVSVERDPRRAAILAINAEDSAMRIFAGGLRNPSGIAIEPRSGALWAAVNERDNLGDDVPADYLTRVVDGGFYGWPYAYAGGQVDNRVPARPDLVAKTTTPDLPLGAHVAPLQIAFATGEALPDDYRHGAFVVEHGSWNRRQRAGYQVVFVPFDGGRPAAAPRAFLSGFVPDPTGKQVYGRPAGVAVSAEGVVFVADDGANVIWQIRPNR